MAAPRTNKLARLSRVGDGKISFIPNDADHDGWLLLPQTVRMVGKKQYAKLFALLGTYYGGSSESTTFGLPPAGDRFLLMAGAAHALGAKGGSETVALTTGQLPKHAHSAKTVKVEATPAQKALLTATILGISTGDITKPPTVSELANQATGEVGGGEAHDNMPPYLAVNVFIFAGMPASA